jgi:hypothetical protein
MQPNLAAWVLAVTLTGAPANPAEDARAAWGGFVERPTLRSYERVVQAIDACTDASCARSVSPATATVGRLVELVQLGQPLAVDAAMHAFRLLDDGDRDRVAQALGEYADVQPTRFLRAASKHRLSAAHLQGIVRTLPRGVEGDAARQDAVERRRQALSGVAEPEVAAERVVALEGLPTTVQPARQGRKPPASG